MEDCDVNSNGQARLYLLLSVLQQDGEDPY